jgi:hypothetical protein
VRKSAVRAIVSMAWRMSFGRVGGADGVRGGLDFDGAAAAGPELGQFSTYLSAGRCGQRVGEVVGQGDLRR